MDDRSEHDHFGADRFDADDRLTQAQELFQQAYELQVAGKFEHAIRLYKQSIEIYPTAEAHTFLGWTYSFQERLDEAIEECRRAIAVDPDFGNPYNDIGAYLIHLERYDEAVPWLELACSARRYNARHYPHFNLGRIYERTGAYREAIAQYKEASRLEPSYRAAGQASERLHAWMN